MRKETRYVGQHANSGYQILHQRVRVRTKRMKEGEEREEGERRDLVAAGGSIRSNPAN